MRENREAPLVSGGSRPDRLEKATSDKASTHARGESDEQVVCAEQRVLLRRVQVPLALE
jgi:hypothetical protein